MCQLRNVLFHDNAMPILEDDYSLMKRTISKLGEGLSNSELRSLIEEFDSVINSRRRSSYIRNCNDLITILEKRGHINPSSYVPLEKIVNRLPSSEGKKTMLARLHNNRERPRTAPCTASNEYVPRESTRQFPGVNHSLSASQRPSNHPGILPDSVMELVSEEIGNKWRDLARKLQLREGDINSIRRECSSDSVQCAYRCLLLYQSKSDPYELEKNLLLALEKARRSDLRNQVHTILNRRDF